MEREPLTAERWRLIETIFHQAAAVDESARIETLARLCKSDAGLRHEVETMLTAADRDTVSPPKTKEPAVDLAGRRIGNYKLERMLGEGGMGAVYLASRADGQFEQQAAVKLLAAYLRGEFFTDRFRVERQALANLNHPNVTRLLDSGVTPDGDPFLVMEYVDGLPIDQYCDQQRLTLPDRIRLFLQVCQAVEYAHRNRIVHRDLKPGNIFVTREGAVKLLDFGTAKLLAVEDGDITRTRFRMLTPRYASPEQLRGEAITHRTDVYSLGILLYELLTGAWPFGDPQSVISGLERAVREVEPRNPKTAIEEQAAARRGLSKAALIQALDGDLGKVILKAIEARPDDRFASVQDFSNDLERYLNQSPVLARPRKFTRRRLAVAAAIIAALLASGSYIAWDRLHPPAASLAVLPFKNLSADPAGRYFSDGVTAEITEAVSGIKPLLVIARASAEELGNKSADVREAGRQLHVTHVLEGTVERQGDRIKLVARLARASNGSEIWSNSFERPLSDLSAIESELAAGIAKKLNARVASNPSRHVVRDPEAIEAYMRAGYEADRFTRESMRLAVADLTHAIERDPEYAQAYAALGVARLNQNNLDAAYHANLSAAEIVNIVSAYYRKALELDPDLPGPRVNLAQLALQFSWDWGGAEREYRTALAKGESPAAHGNYAQLLIFEGRFAEADEQLRLAEQENPYATVSLRILTQALLWESRYPKAIEFAQTLLARDPENPINRNLMDTAQFWAGHAGQALADYRKLELKFPQLRFNEAQVLACQGQREDALRLMQPFEQQYPANNTAAIGYAQFYACLGEEAATIKWLDKSADQHESGLLAIGVGPVFSRVRGGAPFQAVMKRIGLKN